MNWSEMLKCEQALDLLESADVQHEFEDFVVVHIPKDLWDQFHKGDSDDNE